MTTPHTPAAIASALVDDVIQLETLCIGDDADGPDDIDIDMAANNGDAIVITGCLTRDPLTELRIRLRVESVEVDQ